MSIRATSPFTTFLDIDGKPLSLGYVYFGVSGSNPETVPQAVYWDEALTIPAAQPLRTLNGFLVRNGTPASVYLSAVYSVTVRNKNLVLLYSSSLVNPGAPASTAMIPVVSAATLAAARVALGVSPKMSKGYQAISLTHFSDTLEPFVAAGSELEVDGTLYEFPIDEAATAGTWAGIGVDNTVYMYLVPAGALHTWIYSATAPTWDTSKQGWYNGANRAFGVLYKDSGSLYCSKAIAPGQQGELRRTIDIGDWDMDATASVAVAHKLRKDKIRSVVVHVREDSDTVNKTVYSIDIPAGAIAGYYSIGTTTITLTRVGAGSFDNTGFDMTPFNRGWIDVVYAF